MTSMHIRHRRLLSANRRTGLQVDADAALGRASRHAQGWRDINVPCNDERFDAARGIATAVALGALLWIAIIGIVALFVQELAR